MKQLLLIIDMQNGFVNEKTKHIIPNIESLLEHFANTQSLIAFTRFINNPDGAYVKWLGWSELMSEPQTRLIANFCKTSERIFNKSSYTAFTKDFDRFLCENAINTIVICGVETDACILKTAIDAFEKDYQPMVVVDACASGTSDQMHRTGLLLLSKLIGEKQMTTTKNIISLK